MSHKITVSDHDDDDDDDEDDHNDDDDAYNHDDDDHNDEANDTPLRCFLVAPLQPLVPLLTGALKVQRGLQRRRPASLQRRDDW